MDMLWETLLSWDISVGEIMFGKREKSVGNVKNSVSVYHRCYPASTENAFSSRSHGNTGYDGRHFKLE